MTGERASGRSTAAATRGWRRRGVGKGSGRAAVGLVFVVRSLGDNQPTSKGFCDGRPKAFAKDGVVAKSPSVNLRVLLSHSPESYNDQQVLNAVHVYSHAILNYKPRTADIDMVNGISSQWSSARTPVT